MSLTTKSAVRTVSGHSVNFLCVTQLGLYVITDGEDLAPNWTRVAVTRHGVTAIYTARQVLGADTDDSVAAVCRYLAQQLVDKRPALTPIGIAGVDPQALATDDTHLTFNTSLKSLDTNRPEVVQELAQHLLDL